MLESKKKFNTDHFKNRKDYFLPTPTGLEIHEHIHILFSRPKLNLART